jgi:hypothetical protein
MALSVSSFETSQSGFREPPSAENAQFKKNQKVVADPSLVHWIFADPSAMSVEKDVHSKSDDPRNL